MHLKDLDMDINYRTTDGTYSKVHQIFWLREFSSFYHLRC